MSHNITQGQHFEYCGTTISITTDNGAEFVNDVGELVTFRGKSAFDSLRLAQNEIDAEKKQISLVYFNPRTGAFKGGDGSYVSADVTCIDPDADLEPFFETSDGTVCFFRDSIAEISVNELVDRLLSLDSLGHIAFDFGTGLFYTEIEPGKWKHQLSDQIFSAEDVRISIKQHIDPEDDFEKLLTTINRLDVVCDYYSNHAENSAVRIIYQVSVL